MTPVEEVSDSQTAIIECADSVLNGLGKSIGKVVFFHLEKNFRIKKKDIPNQPEVFSKALRSIFGQGANVIERLIVQKIQERFKLRLEPKTSLVEAIQAAKKGTKTRIELL